MEERAALAQAWVFRREAVRSFHPNACDRTQNLAQPNYQYEKRQKDLAKKKKKEEKLKKKLEKKELKTGETPSAVPGEGDSTP
jgi:hypothetical protein